MRGGGGEEKVWECGGGERGKEGRKVSGYQPEKLQNTTLMLYLLTLGKWRGR